MPSITLILAVAILGGVGKNDDDLQTLNSWLNNVLEGIPVKIRPQKVMHIEDENVQKTFPDDRFYSISFATWPVAPRLPKELAYETLVRVRPGGLIEPIRGEAELKSFLAQSLSGIQDEKQAATAGLASLRLTSAVANAASSAFEKPDVSVVQQGSDIIATARAAASAPARGEVEIQLQFGADGKTSLESIKTDDRSRRGPPGG
jgi:hypothetical protein